MISKKVTKRSVSEALFGLVAAILEQARSNVVRTVNTTMVTAYWLIGREIVQAIQGGQKRAKYGQQIIEELSVRLTERYGKGFSVTTLQYFRKFYMAYPARCSVIPRPLGVKSGAGAIPRPTGGEFDIDKKLYPLGREKEWWTREKE